MLTSINDFKTLFDRIKASDISLEDQKAIIGYITQSDGFSTVTQQDSTTIDLSNYVSK